MASATISVAAPVLPAWLADTTRFLFLTGKGGVGKTSIACASATALATLGRRTLLVSTDPASNLDDVFALRVGTVPTPVPGAPLLWVMNIDPVAAAAAYRERMVAPYRGVLPDSAVRGMEEQFSGACTVEIAAFNEFTALLADPSLQERFDHVIFDTAPTGHTLRLLSLPSAWSGFLNTSSSGASCLGPLAGLEHHRAQYQATVAALADATRTTVILVARAESSALREAARAGGELAALGITHQRLVVNGVLAPWDPAADAIAAAYVARQDAALAALPPALRAMPRTDVPLLPLDLTGLENLRALTQPLETARATVGHDAPPPVAGYGSLDALVDAVWADGHGVVMTMGKGGVGKTTIAAALARALARRGAAVHLSTTDPAAHVEAAVGGDRPPGLTVSRIDPVAETAAYAAEVVRAAEEGAAADGGLSPAERALLEEDLRSPCTEEIAVFRAFARTVAGAAAGFVVLDTAPTGHTLLLLDAAESYHREVARTAGSHVPEAVRALLPRLRDPRFTKMLLVTLAESTPVHEAERLQEDLARAGIAPFGWVVNASLAASGTRHPLLARRAALEARHLARAERRHMGNLTFEVVAQRVDAHGSLARCKDAELVLDTDLAGRRDALNPAELLLAALAACMIKGIERVAPMLHFQLRGVRVRVAGERTDVPPRLSSITYEIEVDTDEVDQRLELLHSNVRKYGTVFNTVAPGTSLSGQLRRGGVSAA